MTKQHEQTDANNLAKTGHSKTPSTHESHVKEHSKPDAEHVETAKEAKTANPPAVDPSKPQTATVVNRPDTEENVDKARAAVLAKQDALSAANEEGHKAELDRIEKAHEGGKTVDTEDGPIAAPDPRLGREDNGNTPVIDANGGKSWNPPGVAGVSK